MTPALHTRDLRPVARDLGRLHAILDAIKALAVMLLVASAIAVGARDLWIALCLAVPAACAPRLISGLRDLRRWAALCTLLLLVALVLAYILFSVLAVNALIVAPAPARMPTPVWYTLAIIAAASSALGALLFSIAACAPLRLRNARITPDGSAPARRVGDALDQVPPVRPSARRRWHFRFRVGLLALTSIASFVGLAAASAAMVYLLAPNLTAYQVWAVLAGVMMVFSFVGGLVIMRFAIRAHRARAMLAGSVDDARATDPRGPILLLRSFLDEPSLTRVGAHALSRLAHIRSLEEAITDRLWRLGPVIAVGSPTDTARPLGAARQYLADASDVAWQQFVMNAASEAQLIVVVAGATPGVLWEFTQAQTAHLLHRVLLIVPPAMTDSTWRQFCTQTGAFDAPGIPFGAPRSRIIACRWTPSGAVIYRARANKNGFEAVSLIAALEAIAAEP